jgi:hypothetical protein
MTDKCKERKRERNVRDSAVQCSVVHYQLVGS